MKKKFLFPIVLTFLLVLMPSVAAASSVYMDKETGASFTVPSGWQTEARKDHWQSIDDVFVSSKYPGVTIIYQSMDLWSMLSEAEQEGFTRAECNNSAFTKNEILSLLGVAPTTVTEVTYNGYTYFHFEVSVTPETYNTPTAFTLTHLFRVENGWGYLFQVTGTSHGSHYGDFEELLNSMSYPEVKYDPFKNMPSLVIILLDLLITAAAYLLVPAIFCLKKKQLITKEIKRIVWINGGCVWLLFRILIIALGGEFSVGPAVFLWSAVAYWLLMRNCALDNKNYLGDDPNRIVECKSCGYQSKEYFENCPQCGKGAKQYVYLNDGGAQPTSNDDTTAQ